MKKITGIFLLSLIGYKGMSQLEKGRMMLSAGFNIGNSVNRNYYPDSVSGLYAESETTSQNLFYSLSYGYFIRNNVMIGAGGNYSTRTYINKQLAPNGTVLSKNTSTGNGYAAYLFARRYKMLYKNKLAIFGEARLTYSESKNRPDLYGPVRSSTTNYSLGFLPGITYFINNVVALETSFGSVNFLQQNSSNYNQHGELINRSHNFAAQSTFGLSLANITFGLSFYFGGHQKPEAVKAP